MFRLWLLLSDQLLPSLITRLSNVFHSDTSYSSRLNASRAISNDHVKPDHSHHQPTADTGPVNRDTWTDSYPIHIAVVSTVFVRRTSNGEAHHGFGVVLKFLRTNNLVINTDSKCDRLVSNSTVDFLYCSTVTVVTVAEGCLVSFPQ